MGVTRKVLARRNLLAWASLWLFAVFAMLTSGVHYASGDAATELPYIARVAVSGWNIHQFGNNASSIVTSVIAPFFVRAFIIPPIVLYSTLFVAIFAVTPILLYVLYLKALPAIPAFLSALFFTVTPPTYQEVPTRGKSMVAEPLAVAVILVLLSSLRARWKAPIVCALTILVIVCHYTVGVFLLAWLGIFTLLSSRNRLSAGSALLVGVVVFVVFLTAVGGGAIIHGLRYWGNLPDNHDAIQEIVLGSAVGGADGTGTGLIVPSAQFGNEQVSFVIDLGVPLWAQRLVIYVVAAVLLAGVAYAVKSGLLARHLDAGSATIVCGVCCVLALFWPYMTKGLYLSAWVQIGAIFLSALFGAAAGWFGRSRAAYISLCAILLAVFLVLR